MMVELKAKFGEGVEHSIYVNPNNVLFIYPFQDNKCGIMFKDNGNMEGVLVNKPCQEVALLFDEAMVVNAEANINLT